MSSASKEQISGRLAITNVRVFDGQGLSELTTVVIDGAKIGTDQSGAHTVNGAGGTLLPGLIDAHIHLGTGTGVLEALSAAGITTALDMAAWPPSLVNQHRHCSGVTDIRSAGTPATVPGSVHSRMLPNFPAAGLLGGPDEAEAFVTDRIAEGSDFIKVIADLTGPDQKLLDAIVDAAQRHQRLSVVHAARLEPYQMAVRSRAEVITHVPIDAPISDETAAAIAAQQQVAVPTLVMMEAMAPWLNAINPTQPPLDYGHAHRSVCALLAAGVTVLAGTDANDGPVGVAHVVHGDSLHRELELLVDAGLTPTEALLAATSRTAEVFQLTDRGTISPGLRADLLLVAGDPTSDITAIRQIQQVWCAGIPVDRS
ncbi:MAG TPA: amidohydrolase family protein [Acidimicrobiales bacterium]|nr:amidohydrolase family protein [Acidimicrobiales bacterium]